METLKIQKIAGWCKGKVEDKQLLERHCCGVSIDTRTIKKGELFVAIRGEKQDGQGFAGEALRKGAVAVLAENMEGAGNKCLIKVPDTIKALGEIAQGYRMMFNPYTIGVTGSDGKTTTKELIKKTLSANFPTAATRGNYNNEIGLPLSIFDIDRTKKFCVLEMGMNRKGEIYHLSSIARPQAAVITNVGTAHIGYFNSMAAIAEAKSEIIENLSGEKLCFLNFDSRFYFFFREKAQSRTVSFGMKKGADARGIIKEEKNDSFSFIVEGENELFTMKFWNTAILYPALAAYAVGRKFSVSPPEFRELLEEMEPLPGRGMVCKTGGISVIDESYNCNPNSLKWALYTFGRKNFRKKIAVIGDMEELGRLSCILHRNIGIFARRLDIDVLLTFGKKSRAISETAGKNCRHFEEISTLNSYLSKIIKGGETVLVKGSRTMGLEKTVEYITGRKGR